MLLRPRQESFVSKVCSALKARGNTLGVAPTGAGKTVMMAGVAFGLLDGGGRALVIQHRDELVKQNQRTFYDYNKKIPTGVVNASDKNWSRQHTFAMTQTLERDNNLAALKYNPMDLLIFDEGHRVLAPSNMKIIDACKEANPKCMLYITTATPERGDKKGLRAVVDNCADQITLAELIAAGNLVRPRTFIIDLGVQDALRSVKRNLHDFDMSEVEAIMDKEVHNDKVVEKWKEIAGNRQTVVFCATVNHAGHVVAAFIRHGITAALVTGETGSADREAILKDYDAGRYQVLVNVAVLTEGWDHQPTSCIILLRPSSYKSTMIQMIGRGLRTVDPERYPNVRKSDCIVMDFGTSVRMHGTLEQDVNLEMAEKKKGVNTHTKVCPDCMSDIPMACRECPICGHEFLVLTPPSSDKDMLTDFIMTEIDLFNQSPFRWEILFDGPVMVASAFKSWAMCIFFQGEWHSIGGSPDKGMLYLMAGEKMLCLASADDFMRINASKEDAGKTARWLYEAATQQQLNIIRCAPSKEMTKYRAACFMQWKMSEKAVQRKLIDATRKEG